MDLLGTMVDGVSYAFFLNPATFSGAIDVIVVKQPDGTFKSTPFHIRFGKFQLIRCKEQIVELEINDQPVDVKMQIGSSGEVYFIKESSPELSTEETSEVSDSEPEKVSRSNSQTQLNDNGGKGLLRWNWGGFPKILRSSTDEIKGEKNVEVDDENVEEVTVTFADEEQKSKVGSLFNIFKRKKPQYLSISESREGDYLDYQYAAHHNGQESDEFFDTVGLRNSTSSDIRSGGESDDEFEKNDDNNDSNNDSNNLNDSNEEDYKDINNDINNDNNNDESNNEKSADDNNDINNDINNDDNKNDGCSENGQIEEGHHIASIKKRSLQEKIDRVSEDETIYYSVKSEIDDSILNNNNENNINENNNNNNNNNENNNKSQQESFIIVDDKNIDKNIAEKLINQISDNIISNNNNIDNNEVVKPVNDEVKDEPVSTIKINDEAAQDFLGKKEVEVKKEPLENIRDGTQNTLEKNIQIAQDNNNNNNDNNDDNNNNDNNNNNNGNDDDNNNNTLNNSNIKFENQSPNADEYYSPMLCNDNNDIGESNNNNDDYSGDDIGDNNNDIGADNENKSRKKVAFNDFATIYTPTRSDSSDNLNSLSSSNNATEEEEDKHLICNVPFLLSLSDKLSLLHQEFEFALCASTIFGPFAMTKSQAMEIFKANLLPFDKYEPSVFQNDDLVVRIGDGLYPWSVAQFAVFSLLVFNQPINKATLEKSVEQEEQKRLKKGSWSWIYPWRRKTVEPPPSTTSLSSQSSTDISSPSSAIVQSPPAIEKPKIQRVRTVRSLRPTTEQISAMNLKPGANKVAFSVNAELRGKQTVISTIYLWDYTSKLIISDIDGTITRSDTLGHVLPMLGRDWSHSGVAKLLTAIRNNGYHIVYLTSRPIGQADTTRNFINNLKQDGNIMLPKGPVLMSPDRLCTALNREMILKKPQEFKIACLQDLQRIFPKSEHPFYSGFGNRKTDVMSYHSVGIPSENVFIINPQGEIHTTSLTFNKSYDSLTDLVDELFPAICTENDAVSDDYNDWNFMKSHSIENNDKDLSI